MTEKDWGFAFGELGDPIADIEDWMLPPYPKCINPETHEEELKEKEGKNRK